MKKSNYTRRDFLRKSLIGGAGMSLLGLTGCTTTNASARKSYYDKIIDPSVSGAAKLPRRTGKSVYGLRVDPMPVVRMGVVGVGGRGWGVTDLFIKTGGVEVRAVCDIIPEKVANAKRWVTERGFATPAGYDDSEEAWKKLCERDDLDIIFVATPWELHTPIAVYAMKQGKHVCIEVPAAISVEECWDLVRTAEETQRHCTMLENCCYGETEMLTLSMQRRGVFGTLTHGECAYIHDLRSLLCSEQGEGLWRRNHHILYNGNLYTTHGLGPVAQYMDINTGDKFEYVVSMSSVEAGLTKFAKDHFPEGHKYRQERYICGDMNTTLIKTAKGRSIMLQHDVISPRPYSRINLLSGTGGTFADYPPRLALDEGNPFYIPSEGREKGNSHEWMEGSNLSPYFEKYQSRIWKESGERARQNGGHGGMDFIMCYRLVESLKKGEALDINVYDTAAWCVIGPLSRISVANNGVPVQVPDFTRGEWKNAKSCMQC